MKIPINADQILSQCRCWDQHGPAPRVDQFNQGLSSSLRPINIVPRGGINQDDTVLCISQGLDENISIKNYAHLTPLGSESFHEGHPSRSR
ncbi:hypothetical protein FBY06_107161 [Pseudomonas sp. SJZ085]|nr:hypothetical protein FBY00_1224 [Pseudomonas sp. SJZ075]TWC21282.1 hypothetical protein FBX99_10718 [Pseudomonas sp. SJZ074]TWC29555.1 hypothetical protein FBY02_12279 [Pseudomonas sp. SJZ078]TWC39219.1 hypothetical protein FBY06_107161 [Pseudomonas sp. SJZ085]TWC49661.1 hypothetical protein FBY11_1234 [Pseudomonas sp. SJZ124]TWC85714.1 hypothetical protein FBY09_1224 [Pseudomonas sp. SJZ101]